MPTSSTTGRVPFDDVATIRTLASSCPNMEQLLRAMGYQPGSTHARTRLKHVATQHAIVLPLQVSPFADLDKVREALTTCPTRAQAARFLGASLASKTFQRLDNLADQLGVPRLPAAGPGNRTGRQPTPRGQAEREAVHTMSPEHLARTWAQCQSVGDLLAAFGLARTQTSRQLLEQVAQRHGLQVPDGRHIRLSPDVVLVAGRETSQDVLRRCVIDHGLLDPSVCVTCGQGTIWQGKPLTLELDHISGDRTDNRLSNLRFLCPNCHAITSTFRGRNQRRSRRRVSAHEW